MFDNYNKILKQYQEVAKEIQENKNNLKDAQFELRDPQGYEKWTKERAAGQAAIIGAAEGAKPGKTGGFGTLKG